MDQAQKAVLASEAARPYSIGSDDAEALKPYHIWVWSLSV
jgi:hypothetical protein